MILNRKVLKFEIDLDFVLIAITTSLKDYRICYLINKFLNFNFIKIADLPVDIFSATRPEVAQEIVHQLDHDRRR